MADAINYHVVNTDNKWKILRTHWRYSWWAIWVSFGTIMQGFDNVANSEIISMIAFTKQFGVENESDPGTYFIPSRWLGGWQGAMQAGSAIGAFAAGYLMDRIGRKKSILIACSISCIGVGVQYAAHEWQVYLAGKFVNGLAIGIWFTLAPTWIGENARPECRGLFLCLYNSTIVFGQALVAFVAQGAVKIDGPWSYRIIILLQMMFPAIGFAGYLFFAESPYWLIQQDRMEDARKQLIKLYTTKHADFVDFELGRLHDEARFATELKAAANLGGPAIWQVWRGGNRIRTFTAVFISAGQQLMGASFVLGYLTYFLQLIHVKNAFSVSAGLFVVMLCSTTTAFPLIEIFGRRKILIVPCFMLVFILLLIGIMGCISNTSAAGYVITTCIFLWGAVYQFSLGATGFAVASEIATLPLRAQTQGYIVATDAFFGWLIGFVVPYMINPRPDGANMGGKVGFVFFGLGSLVAIALYFIVPDTRGLSFDELDWLYSEKVSPRKFQEVIKSRIESGDETLEVRVGEKTISTHINQIEAIETKSVAVAEQKESV
ncbi:hypothetical protein LTR43_005144 [Exophiala xenobiotica]|nr:hypothetical protein LTR14_003748 [Exophiala xenobiotica]